jgi:hypothetical protein
VNQKTKLWLFLGGHEQSEKKQPKHYEKRSPRISQGHGKGDYRSSPPSDPYALLQNIRLPRPERTPRSNDNSRPKRADGQSEGKRTRTEGGERQSRGPRATSQTGENSGSRQAARSDRNNGPRAESSRQSQKDRAPRLSREPTSHVFDAPARKSEPTPVVRAAPTVEELFGDSSMLSEQSGVENQVFEGVNLSGGEGASKRMFLQPRSDLPMDFTETDLAFCRYSASDQPRSSSTITRRAAIDHHNNTTQASPRICSATSRLHALAKPECLVRSERTSYRDG